MFLPSRITSAANGGLQWVRNLDPGTCASARHRQGYTDSAPAAHIIVAKFDDHLPLCIASIRPLCAGRLTGKPSIPNRIATSLLDWTQELNTSQMPGKRSKFLLDAWRCHTSNQNSTNPTIQFCVRYIASDSMVRILL